MAGTTFKKRDLNRFRKTYPYIRRKPIQSYVSEKETILEAGSLTFSAASSATHTFTEIYDSAPFVTAIAVDTDSNDGADVNIYISNITKTFVTFESSQEFTGAVHFHVILISTD